MVIKHETGLVKPFGFVFFLFSILILVRQGNTSALPSSYSNQFNYRVELALFSTFIFYQSQKNYSGFSLIPEFHYTPTNSENWDGLVAIKLLSLVDLNYPERRRVWGDFYRFWFRYQQEQWEFRLGLQKIEFGSATYFRPLQWFNNLDPYDPLQQTPGVWAMLYRYYFRNQSNIWMWGLWGNKEIRGLDMLPTYLDHPEAGGRIQFSLPKGEAALTFHYRTVTTPSVFEEQYPSQVPELRLGIDTKWDLVIGLWSEVSWVHKFKFLGDYSDRLFISLGMDYTFPWGNGYHFVWENLISVNDTRPFLFQRPVYDSIWAHTYPLGFFDNISLRIRYRWVTHEHSIYLGWDHQFSLSTLSLIVYYQTYLPQSGKELGLSFFWKYVF